MKRSGLAFLLVLVATPVAAQLYEGYVQSPVVYRYPAAQDGSTCQASPGRNVGEAMTVTRGSSASLTSGATVTTCSSNQARVDSTNGLAVEPAATNRILRSEEFDNAAWNPASGGGGAPGNPTITANVALAPDGTMTADRVAFPAVSGAGDYSIVYQADTVSSATYSNSQHFATESGTATIYLMLTPDGSNFTTVACSITTTWSRCLNGSRSASGTLYYQFGVDRRDGSQTAKSAQTVLVWGGQNEASAYPTSYIKTTSATVTRSADAITAPLAALGSDWCVDATLKPSGAWTVAADPLGFGTKAAANSFVLTVDTSGNIDGTVYDASSGTKTKRCAAGLSGTAAKQVTFCNAAGTLSCYLDGVANGTAASGAGTGLIATWPTSAGFGIATGGTSLAGNLKNVRLCRSSYPDRCWL